MDPLDVAWAACGQERLLATPLQMALVAGSNLAVQ
jgi:cell division protein FtsI/penicillin-binding protein 2